MSTDTKKYEINMCEGSIVKKLVLFTAPLIFSGLLQLLYNAADIIVVGRFAGKNSLAAVGSTTSLINLITNIFIGLSSGISVVTARAFGSKNKESLSRAAGTSVTLGIISGFIIMIFGFFASKKLLSMMECPPEVLDLAAVYMKIFFLGSVGNMVYNFAGAILRAMGDTKRPLYYLSFSGSVNIVLNLVFVIIFKMDVAGVALATIISQYISAFLVVRCLVKSEKLITKNNLKIHKTEFSGILKIGLPAGVQGVLFSLSNVLIQSSINSFGADVIAGNAAASSLEGFVYIAMNAFHHGAITFVGQNFGAGNIKRIKKGIFVIFGLVTAVGLIFGNGIILFSKPLLAIYNKEPEVISMGILRLKYVATLYCLCGLMDTAVGVLRGLGHALIPMLISLFGACVFRIIWIYTIFAAAHTLEILFVSYPVSWILTFAMQLMYYKIVTKKQYAKFAKPSKI